MRMEQNVNAAAANESLVFFATSEESKVQGTLLHLSRYHAAFEVYHSHLVLRV